MSTPPITLEGWAALESQVSHRAAQRLALERLRSIPTGTQFKLKHLLADELTPRMRGAAIIAAQAVVRHALRLSLIRRADGVAGLVPYYERVR